VAAATVCPKCSSERRPGADSCARCGLLVSRWAGFVPSQPAADPLLDGLWARVEAGWEDDAPHARFLDQAAVLGALDLAAARYRTKLRGDSAPRAQAGLDRAVRRALQLQEAAALRPREDPSLAAVGRWVKYSGISVAIALFIATLWVVWAALGRR
jgi:hypothetical protein